MSNFNFNFFLHVLVYGFGLCRVSAFCILAAYLLSLPDGKKGGIICRKVRRRKGERKESGSVTLRQTNINIINNVASQLTHLSK